MIKKYLTNISSLYKGTTKIASAYKGDQLVYSSGLPSEYQEVEWIKNNTKGAYFDTQLSVANTTRIQANAKFEWVEVGGSESCFLGCRTNSDRCMIFNMYPSLTWEVGYTSNYASGSKFTLNTLYEVSADLQNGSQTVVANRDTVVSATISGTITQTNTLWILANNYSRSTNKYNCRAKIYSMDISIDGVKERDFVPCYRKADNVIGLYDLVYGTFYTNQGSGTFTKGNDV